MMSATRLCRKSCRKRLLARSSPSCQTVDTWLSSINQIYMSTAWQIFWIQQNISHTHANGRKENPRFLQAALCHSSCVRRECLGATGLPSADYHDGISARRFDTPTL